MFLQVTAPIGHVAEAYSDTPLKSVHNWIGWPGHQPSATAQWCCSIGKEVVAELAVDLGNSDFAQRCIATQEDTEGEN